MSGSVSLLAACPANRRRAQHKNWRTGASPLLNLQGRPVGLYRNTHGRATYLFAGANDRRHFMTAMSTAIPIASALAQFNEFYR